MNEIWKPVVGYEGIYEVSSLGNIRRIKKTHGATAMKKLKKLTSSRGSHVVILSNNNIQSFKQVHLLTAAAFIPFVTGKNFIKHKDGNIKNNCVRNLSRATLKESWAALKK